MMIHFIMILFGLLLATGINIALLIGFVATAELKKKMRKGVEY